MKHRLGSVTIEAIDTYVRITIENFNGIGTSPRIGVTKHETPTDIEVVQLLMQLRESTHWPDKAHLQACSRAAYDARANKEAKELNI